MLFTKNRAFNWVSSSNGPAEVLSNLEERMSQYYSQWEVRQTYQKQINNPEHHQPDIESALVKGLLSTRPNSVLEVGCGSGRLYQRLQDSGYHGTYTGVEMSAEVIAQNQKKFPNAVWVRGSMYEAPVGAKSFDAVFSYFVLEHCVYPHKGLERLFNWLAPGGSLFLVFPDFLAMGHFSSQHVGSTGEVAREHLRRFHLLQTVITLFDSRFRLPRAIRNASKKVGPFPINITPRCLLSRCAEIPDTDAIYLSSKSEVAEWGKGHGCEIIYPAGTDGAFRATALIQLLKPKSASDLRTAG